MQQVGMLPSISATEPDVRAPAATPIAETFAGLLSAHMGELGPPRDVSLEGDVGEGSPDLAAESEGQPVYSEGFAVVSQWTMPLWLGPAAPGLVDPRLLSVADLANAPRAAGDSRATMPWVPQLSRLAQVDASLGDGGDGLVVQVDTGAGAPFDPDASPPSLLPASTVNEDVPSMARDATLVSPPWGVPVSRIQGSVRDPALGSPQTPTSGSTASLAVQVEGGEERAPAEIAPGLDQALGMVKTAALAAVATAPEGRLAGGADAPVAGKEGFVSAGVPGGPAEDAEAWSDQRTAPARADIGIATPMRTGAPSVADARHDDHRAPDVPASAPSQAESPGGPGAALDPFGVGARNPGGGPAIPYATETTSAQTGRVGLSDVATEVRSLVIAGGREAHLRLEPESLGPVNVSVKYEGGQVSIDISVQTSAAREALQAALPHLRASLEEENLPVAQLNLSGGSAWDLATGGGEQRGGQQQAFVASFTSWEEDAFGPARGDGEGPSRPGLLSPLGQSVDRRA